MSHSERKLWLLNVIVSVFTHGNATLIDRPRKFLQLMGSTLGITVLATPRAGERTSLILSGENALLNSSVGLMGFVFLPILESSSLVVMIIKSSFPFSSFSGASLSAIILSTAILNLLREREECFGNVAVYLFWESGECTNSNCSRSNFVISWLVMESGS
jgi:hypothetical protein